MLLVCGALSAPAQVSRQRYEPLLGFRVAPSGARFSRFGLDGLLTGAPWLPPFSRSLDGLPGSDEINHASARPAARVFYLLYAAALDQFAQENARRLGTNATLAALVEYEFAHASETFRTYNTVFESFSESVDPLQERKSLQDFLTEGYRGRLQADAEAYLAELHTKPPLRKETRKGIPRDRSPRSSR